MKSFSRRRRQTTTTEIETRCKRVWVACKNRFFLFPSVAAVSFPSPCGVRVCMKFHYQRERKKEKEENGRVVAGVTRKISRRRRNWRESGGGGSKGGVISPPPSTFSFPPPRSARRLKDCLAMHVVFVAKKSEGKRSKCGKDKIFSHFFTELGGERRGGRRGPQISPKFYCQSDDFLLRPGRRARESDQLK